GFVAGPLERELSIEDLAALYSAADVHLLTSFGEGFGLPTLQAASCGVVPVAPANSASSELVGGHGFAISCDSSSTDEFGLVRHFIDRQEAAGALQELYENPDLLAARAAAARCFALAYDWDTIARRWDGLFCRRGRASRGTCQSSLGGAAHNNKRFASGGHTH